VTGKLGADVAELSISFTYFPGKVEDESGVGFSQYFDGRIAAENAV